MKEKVLQALLDYFCFNDEDGTYAYNLTRVKEGFAYGTVTLDDFEEFTEEQMEELADFIFERCEKAGRRRKAWRLKRRSKKSEKVMGKQPHRKGPKRCW